MGRAFTILDQLDPDYAEVGVALTLCTAPPLPSPPPPLPPMHVHTHTHTQEGLAHVLGEKIFQNYASKLQQLKLCEESLYGQ